MTSYDVLSVLVAALVLSLVEGIPTSKRVMQVFGAKPEGGFWGVEVDVRREGRTDALDWSPLGESSLKVAGAAFDPKSGYVALEGHDPHSLAYSPMCTSGGKAVERVITNMTSFTQYTSQPSTNCVDCHATSFAIHGSKVYFLLIGDFGIDPNLAKNVQLRVLDSCERCQISSDEIWESLEVFGTPFLFNCSHVIANIYSVIPTAEVDTTLKAGKQLKIVEDGGGLSFFFQLFIGRRKSNKHDVNLNLYHVNPATDVTLLREEKVHSRYATWNIQAMASVDYRDGLLCWTAADRLYCGQYQTDRGRITGEKMLLFPGEGASSQVCTGKLTITSIQVN